MINVYKRCKLYSYSETCLFQLWYRLSLIDIYYIQYVYTGWRLKSRMFCISGDYNIYSQFQYTATKPNDYIIKSLTDVKRYRGKFF